MRWRAVIALVLFVLAGVSAREGLGLELAQTTSYSVGDIRSIDRDARTVTLDHGPLLNLNVPPGIRVFQVDDALLLEPMKVGEALKFIADNASGRLTIVGVQTGLDDGHGDH